MMKRFLFVLFAILMTASALLAWQYSCQTSWNGSIWVTGSVSFTPGSTHAEVMMSAPDSSQSGCGACDQDPPYYDWYRTEAVLRGPGVEIVAPRDCGGCAKTSGTVTTNQTWTLYAIFDPSLCPQQTQQQSWGPVVAKAGNLLPDCFGTGPGGQ